MLPSNAGICKSRASCDFTNAARRGSVDERKTALFPCLDAPSSGEGRLPGVMSSLRVRLLLLVGAVLVPSLLLLLGLVVRERQVQLEVVQAAALSRVDEGLLLQEEEVNDGLRILEALVTLPVIRNGDTESCQRALATLSTMLEEGRLLARTLADGTQDCTTRNPGAPPVNVADNPLFLAIRETNAPLVGPFIRSPQSNELLQPVNVPIQTESGEFLGVLSAALRMRWFDWLVTSVSATDGAVVSLSTPGGVLLRRVPDDAASQIAHPDSPIAMAMRENPRGVIEADGIDGVRRVWAFTRLASPDSAPVFLSVGFPAEAVYQGVNDELRDVLLVLLAWLVVVAGLAWWATDRFVLRDVRTLLQATERLGAGDLTVRTGSEGRSIEMARLSASFDQMASRLEERQSREAQAQKLESIGQLAGGVAHDFNNLLTAIIGNAELARDSLPPSSPARRELDAALDAADRSAALTRQLLAFARHTELAPRVVRVDTLLHAVSALLRRLIGEHITLSVDAGDDLRPAKIDASSVEQAIVNLVVNARDAMPAGGQVVITARNVLVQGGDNDHAHGVPTGEWIVITVRDTGSGMPRDVLDHAFEPFFTTKPVGKGTGLGLAMVYGTVVQHSGHLWVESAPGHGTAVRLFFPPAQAGAEPDPLAPVVPRSPVVTGRAVLLVEDERAVRALVARVLGANGFEVIQAEDGEDALAQCDAALLARIDLVVTDVVMPKLGGPELISALRERRPDLPVLFMSGYRENHTLDAVIESEHTGFLPKPFTPGVLLSAVHERLDENRAALR